MENPADPRLPRRRRLLQAMAVAPVLASLPLTACAREESRGWPGWRALVDTSLSADGRMIDRSEPDQRTTSEGQSYALFFALVDGDRGLFDRILAWTRDNLAEGDLSKRLPAWHWGQDAASGEWRVLDANPAADSDLWIAYCLIEAARRWDAPAHAQVARSMLLQIQAREVARLPGLGLMLLPGPVGFTREGLWRLNPSYLPIPVLRRLQAFDPGGPWGEIARNTVRLVRESAPHGWAPDWLGWRDGAVVADPVRGTLGSYDAIRTYLWAGMTHRADPAFRPMLDALHGPRGVLARGQPLPEKVDTARGGIEGNAPFGFRAALLPDLQVSGAARMARTLRQALPDAEALRAGEPSYYSHVLKQFGAGWYDRRFRFDRHGALQPGR